MKGCRFYSTMGFHWGCMPLLCSWGDAMGTCSAGTHLQVAGWSPGSETRPWRPHCSFGTTDSVASGLNLVNPTKPAPQPVPQPPLVPPCLGLEDRRAGGEGREESKGNPDVALAAQLRFNRAFWQRGASWWLNGWISAKPRPPSDVVYLCGSSGGHLPTQYGH